MVNRPMFALANELAQRRESKMAAVDAHALCAVRLEEEPVLADVAREATLGSRGGQQICATGEEGKG